MRSFHLKSWSGSTIYLGVMCPDGNCWVVDSFDEDYNPISVKREHIFRLILDKNVGSIEFGINNVEQYIDKFPEIKKDFEQESTKFERKLYIELVLSRLPSESYYMELLLEVYKANKEKHHVSEDDFYEMEEYRELENIGYVTSEKKTTHAYNEDYYFYLTEKGKNLVEEHLSRIDKV